MRIQHNISALNSLNNYNGNNTKLSGNLEKLSSGYRINSAADDAAGLAISEKMRSQIAGLEKAQDNANDGISLIQTAEGALTEVNSMLTRLTELASQSANGTYQDDVDRDNLQEEANALLNEMDRISQSTNFNGINLLDGSLSSTSSGPTQISLENMKVGDQISFGGKTYTYAAADDVTGKFGTSNTTPKAEKGNGTEYKVGDDVPTSVVNYSFGSEATAEVDATAEVGGESFTFTGNVTAVALATPGTPSGLNPGTYTYDGTTSKWKDADGNVADVSKLTITAGAGAANGDTFTITGGTGSATSVEVSGAANTANNTVFTYQKAADGKVTKDGWYSAAGNFLETSEVTLKNGGTEVTPTSGMSIKITDKGAAAVDKVDGQWNVQSDNLYAADGTKITNDNAGDYFSALKKADGTVVVTATNDDANNQSIFKDGKVTPSTSTTVSNDANNYSFSNVTELAALINRDGAGNYSALTSTKTVDGETIDTVNVTARALSLQVGDTNNSFQHVAVDVADMSAAGLGLRNSYDSVNKSTYLNISDQESAGKAIDTIKAAVNTVSSQRGKLGATQNRLDHTLNNLEATTKNITASESQIRDVDMAKEMTEYSKNNILVQAAQSMLAQANSMPQGVLQLLQ